VQKVDSGDTAPSFPQDAINLVGCPCCHRIELLAIIFPIIGVYIHFYQILKANATGAGFQKALIALIVRTRQGAMEFRLIYSPWMTRFLTAVSKVEKEMLLLSPFVKKSLVEPMLLALPDTGIDIRLVTRFSTQNFQQLSSDFSALQLLRHRPVATGPTSVYKLNRLHAKVYIFDRRFVFLGSSNLSVSGFDRNFEMAIALDNPGFAEQIYADLERYGALGMPLNDSHFEEMRATLRIPSSAIFLATDAVQSIEDDAGSIEEATTAQPEPPMPIDPMPIAPDSESRKRKLDEFISNVLNSDLNGIGGIQFESPLHKEHAAAERDIARIRKEVAPSLDLPEETAKSEMAILPFIHQSWCALFPDLHNTGVGLPNEIFCRLGADVVWIELAILFARQIAFDPVSAGAASIAVIEVAQTLDYEAFLNAKGLNVLLHLSNLPKKISRDQFRTALGLVCFYRKYSDASRIARQLLEEGLTNAKIDEITTDPKSRLQEILHLLGNRRYPVYITERSGGTEHKPEFRSQVRLGTRSFGPVVGPSKKAAETNVAKLAVAALVNENPQASDNVSKQNQHASHGYVLFEDRRIECIQIASRLGLKYKRDVVLLDLALTHTSYILQHPRSRSYQRLAFVGSTLAPLLGCFQYIRDYGWKGQDAHDELVRRERVLNGTVLTEIFDELELGNYIRSAFDNSLLTERIRKDVIQSILATAYLWGGFDQALAFWDQFIAPVLKKALANAVDLDPKSLFQEASLSKLSLNPTYRCTRIGGPDNKPRFRATVYLGNDLVGAGEGGSKKEAEKEAASAGLKKIEIIWKKGKGKSVDIP
jgi:ribonuclease III